MKKTVIKINPDKCTGCGQCAATCHQGVIEIINGKAVLTDEHHCDGLGRCIGNCPSNAISFFEKEVLETKAEKSVLPKSAFVMSDFQSFKKGKRVAIACPKLDSEQEIYNGEIKYK